MGLFLSLSLSSSAAADCLFWMEFTCANICGWPSQLLLGPLGLRAAVDGKLNFGRVCLIHFVLFVLPPPLGTGTVYAPLHSMHAHKALF